MKKYEDVVLDRNGNVIAGATIVVKKDSDDSTATVYPANAPTGGVTSVTSDSNGRFSFYAKDETYYLVISKTGITTQTTASFVHQDVTPAAATVVGFGAVGDGSTSDTAAVTACAAASVGVVFPPSDDDYVLSTTPTLSNNLVIVQPGATLSGSGADAIGYAGGPKLEILQHGTDPADFASVYLRRQATHTTGSAGTVASALRAETYVTGNAGNFEWTACFKMDSNSTGGENTALYAQGIKRQSASPVWGATIEVIESADVADPAAGTVGLEVDVRSGGTDASAARVGIDVVGTRRVQGSGTSTQIGWGVRVQGGGDGADALFVRGIGFASGCNVFNGFDTSLATVLAGAYVMADGQAILFDASGTYKTYHASSAWNYSVSNDVKARFSDTGIVQSKGGVQPSTPALAFQTAATLYAGSGAPNNANGANGDFYFRSDGTVAGNTVIYHKEGGSWVACTTA